MSKIIFKGFYDERELVGTYPPAFEDPNKQAVYEISTPPGSDHSGEILVSRWKQMELPEPSVGKDSSTAYHLEDGFFTYDPPAEGRAEWHLNFAHSDLFCAYAGSLFAQDEMQVAEHPALGSLGQALEKSGNAKTVEHDCATPVLIVGVGRRCSISTEPNAGEGRPWGLYGNHFADADEEAVRKATKPISPPTKSNILAMEAPPGGYDQEGKYLDFEIQYILETAYTGFRAAVIESKNRFHDGIRAVIHTGYWGCGAYGGNPVLMPLLQMLAANWAGVDELIFHGGGRPEGYLEAKGMLGEVDGIWATQGTAKLITHIANIGFKWGQSDGN